MLIEHSTPSLQHVPLPWPNVGKSTAILIVCPTILVQYLVCSSPRNTCSIVRILIRSLIISHMRYGGYIIRKRCVIHYLAIVAENVDAASTTTVAETTFAVPCIAAYLCIQCGCVLNIACPIAKVRIFIASLHERVITLRRNS